MKTYSVLLKKDSGTNEIIVASGNNANDVRWECKKIQGVYEAVILRRLTF